MSKLFKESVYKVAVETSKEGVLPDEDMSSTIADYDSSLNNDLEATEMALERLQTLQGMKSHLTNQTLCSVSYLNSMESYSPLIKSMGERMGVKHFPSLESFSSPMAAKDAHEFAMEGFKDMVSKVWEKIKSFFKTFFKNVSLFMKRLVNANLELKDYEEYCERLIAKLSANDAKLGDNSPLDSKLPSLLADEGMNKIDSGYVLNEGRNKMLNLLDEATRLSVHVGGNLAKRLDSLTSNLRAFAGNEVDDVNFDHNVAAIREDAFNLLTSLFSQSSGLNDNIPHSVLKDIADHYRGEAIESKDIQIFAVSETGDPLRKLPRGVNIFMTHVNKDHLFVQSSKYVTAVIENKLPPIGNIQSLSGFYKEYKNTIGAFNLNKIQKDTEYVSNSMGKVLETLHKDMGPMLEKYRVKKIGNSTPEALFNLAERLVGKVSKVEDVIDSTVDANVASAAGADVATVTTYFTPYFFELIMYMSRKDSEKVKIGSSSLFDILEKLPKEFLPMFIGAVVSKHNLDTGSQIDETETNLRFVAVKELNTFLNTVFTRFSLTYKTIATDFFGVITETRYATIKYIYDSARRYN